MKKTIFAIMFVIGVPIFVISCGKEKVPPSPLPQDLCTPRASVGSTSRTVQLGTTVTLGEGEEIPGAKYNWFPNTHLSNPNKLVVTLIPQESTVFMLKVKTSCGKVATGYVKVMVIH